MRSGGRSPALVCNPDALAPEQRRKHHDVAVELFRLAGANRELPNGLEFQFLNEESTLALVTEFIVDEEVCCPFLDCDVHIKPQESLLQLSLTGPENTTEFLQAEFADFLQS